MTDHDLYTKRIEAIARAMRDNSYDRKAGYILTEDFSRMLARIADKAVLEAIKSPTEEMIQACNTGTLEAEGDAIDNWYIMWRAIPRGET